MRHGAAEACAHPLENDFIGDVASRRMADTLDEAMHSLPRVADCAGK